MRVSDFGFGVSGFGIQFSGVGWIRRVQEGTRGGVDAEGRCRGTSLPPPRITMGA